jgi:polysaccharide pyruvyl transferase WcaK-like protein
MSRLSPDSIAFAGYYGMQNFGDDLFAFVCLWGASKYWTNTRTKVIAPPIKGLAAAYAVPGWYGAKRYSKIGVVGQLSRLTFSLKEAVLNQGIVFGGGSNFGDNESQLMNLYRRISGIGRPAFSAIGVSIGPFKSADAEARVGKFLRNFSYVSVRDKASYACASEMGLTCPLVLAGDLAAVMPLIVPPAAIEPQRGVVIGVSLCSYTAAPDGQSSAATTAALINAVVHSAKQYAASIKVFSLNNHAQLGDDRLSAQLCRRLKDENIPFTNYRNVEYGVIDIWRHIASCSAFVSVRLHGAIAAYLNDVPFALVEYHRKCTDFLDDIGQDPYLRIKGPTAHENEIKRVIGGLLARSFPVLVSAGEYQRGILQHFTSAPWSVEYKKHD